MTQLTAQSEQVRHIAVGLECEVIHYVVLGTRLNRDNARKHIAKMRELLDEIEQGIAEREQARGREVKP
jgi:hypothetical protein